MATINLPFAASATKRAPDSDELANGFPCGDADKQLFDWLEWWLTGQIASAIAKSGQAVDDADLNRLATAIRSQLMNYRPAGGTANAISISLDPTPAGWNDLTGVPLRILITNQNTGAVTVAISGLPGTKAILRPNKQPLQKGDLPDGSVAELYFDGAAFQLTSFNGSTLPATQRTIYDTAGSYTFTATANGRHKFTLGGGGGGGGRGQGGGASAGNGGSMIEVTVPMEVGDTASIVVGAAGAPAASSANGVTGGSGGDSSVTVNGVTYTAAGGAGGNSTTNQSSNAPTAPSVPTSGDVRLAGAQGGAGISATAPSQLGGTGGDSPMGGLGGIGSGGAAGNGTAPGGGGGGSGGGGTAGSGARGEVWVEW